MREQKVFGAEVLEKEIQDITAERNIHRVLLVCGASFRRQPLYERLLETLKKSQISVTEFSEFAPNPDYGSVIAGIRAYREAQCEMIVAAGGGSAMDVAKCIKLFADMDIDLNCLTQEIVENEIPILAIPTTAGTGSEATRFAVIYYQGNKQSVDHVSCIPEYVLMDASLLATLPAYQRKATMMDALCHAIESFWSVKATKESQEYAAEAIRMVLANEQGYLENEAEGSRQMLFAANLAGKAINLTQTTAGHAMAYKLTTLYGLAHGHAVALCVDVLWPYMTAHKEDCIDSRGSDYLTEMFRELAHMMGCNDETEAAERYHHLLERLELARPSIAEADLDKLAGSVNLDRLKNHPVQLNEAALRALYEQIKTGR